MCPTFESSVTSNWAMQLLAVRPLLRLYNISPHTSRRMKQQFLGSASGPTAGGKHQFLSHSWVQSCQWRRMGTRQQTISRLGKWELTLSSNCVYVCLSYLFLSNQDPLRTWLGACLGGLVILEAWLTVNLSEWKGGVL